MEPNNTSGLGFSGMVESFKKIEWTPINILKFAVAAVIGLVVLTFAFQLIASPFKMLSHKIRSGEGGITGMVAPSMPVGMGGGYSVSYDSDYYNGGYDSAPAADHAYAKEEMAAQMGAPAFSARNAASMIYPAPIPPDYGTTGDTAEEFEVTQYSASIETRDSERDCAAFADLKKRDDVIFENANTYERGCNFTFKVEHKSVNEVLAWLKEFDPKDLSENTYTIKSQIEDYTNEIEVLQKKLESIDQTLNNALRAYDDVTRLATQSQNADALASIINSKIAIIERLTQEKININEHIDRYTRSKADQMDRLVYTYFHVSVYEDRFVDPEQIEQSWKHAIQNFVRDLNKFVQDLTINLLLVLLFILQWAIYAVILLFVVKYGWRFAHYIWFK